MRKGMARRLLRLAIGIVSNSALYGMVMWCIGCVIPTPLDSEPAPKNFRPSFVTTQVTPPFGPLTEHLASTGSTLALAATDPNTGDTLKVHLFQPNPNSPFGYDFIGWNATLAAPLQPDSEEPNLRVGTIQARLCNNARDNDKFDIYAAVADREFNMLPANITLAAGGFTEMNHWEVTCTAM
jgi:hypothetical protein